MSYDLFFYKKQVNPLTNDQIAGYLSQNLAPVNEAGNQWLFENETTEVYYYFENSINDIRQDIDEPFEGFQTTGIHFHLNFARPAFFGLEAFAFIEQFIKDLDLYIFNPQAESPVPSKEDKTALFQNWNKSNIWASKEFMNENSVYYPVEQTNAIWVHNYNTRQMQYEIGNDYYVSRVFFFKKTEDSQPVTLSVWAQHIPNVLPVTDYYMLFRKYKKLFKTVEDMVLLSREDFDKYFSEYFEPYKYTNTIVIHPEKSKQVAKLFNTVKSDLDTEKHLIRVAADSIVNVLKD